MAIRSFWPGFGWEIVWRWSDGLLAEAAYGLLMMKLIFPLLALFWTGSAAWALEPPPRVFPPVGDQLPEDERAALAAELEKVTREFESLPRKSANANAEVFLKAVRYALDYSEFYKPGDVADARALLDEASVRISALRQGKAPWLSARGLVVRGYYSPIDGSPQPFGMEIPDDAPAKAAPAWMWLQGRGEKRTDLHFLRERMTKKGQFQPPGTIIVHPWGRYCVGTKGAGEQDVLHVRELLVKEGVIDPGRVALAGFSMGGAGAWMMGAHFADLWKVVHAGAGFVEVRKYQKLTEETVAAMPPWQVTLWGQNDVPAYVRNLLNVPLIAYSGEIDKQREAAEIMTAVLAEEGLELRHYLGPKTEHKYEPETRKEVEAAIQRELLAERPRYPLALTFQTRTLDYPRLHWIEVTGLAEHWQDSRVDAVLDAPIPAARKVSLTTRNVTSLKLKPPVGEAFSGSLEIHIDGQVVSANGSGKAILLTRSAGKWRAGAADATAALRKRPGLQGPIDDAFTGSFLYVLPDRACASAEMERWVKAETGYQTDRWRYLMRGDLRWKKAADVTGEDVKSHHLILWGDAAGNSLIGRVLEQLPVRWDADTIAVGETSVPAAGHALAMVYPNPFNPEKYVVFNSGLSFRENHKSNAVQNPQLPDWALIDLSTPPDGWSPGRVAAAGFFGENWEVK
jgi:hypothetical protein